MKGKNEERKNRIFKKANDMFKECGFNDIDAKDVVGHKFVLSFSEKDSTLQFGTIPSFTIGDSLGKAIIWLYPKFERSEGYNYADAILLHSGEAYESSSNTIQIFRNDKNADPDIFFDFI